MRLYYLIFLTSIWIIDHRMIVVLHCTIIYDVMNEVHVHHKHTSTLLAFFSHNGKCLISNTDFMSSNWVLDPVYYLIKLYDSCLQNVFCTLNPSMKTYFYFCKFIYNTRREACHLAKTCILWLHKKFYGTLRHNWKSGCGLGTFWSRCMIQLPHSQEVNILWYVPQGMAQFPH